jgi:uncharacterized membrane protein YcaP (DUF421 family)
MSYASPRTVTWEYRVQRLGFSCYVAIALAAAFGLLGDRARVVAHTAAIYLLLLLIFRIAGRRTLAETSSFDLVLLLIIGETTQQAMVGSDDDSLLTAAVAILSLVSLDMGITYLKKAFPAFDRLIEGHPILLINEGELRPAAMNANGLDDEDLKEAARLSHGLGSVKEIRQATLERDGKISIIPWREKHE